MKTLLIAFLLSSSFAHASRFVVEAKHSLTKKELAQIKGMSVKLFSNVKDSYFSRLYVVTGNVSKASVEKQAWVSRIEDQTEITRLSLEPANNPERLVQDELFPYQWYLLNQGQTYVREKDDIHNIPLIGTAGSDVAWKSVYKNLPKNRVIVAVLDSGVDINHPDLQGNLWTNEKECGKDATVDNDNNTLKGDCHGWNFTVPDSDPDVSNPNDNDGHGTHVAGIIAAANNGIGIVGVNPNALIMPVKVMKDANSKSNVSSSESFASGILYATDMGAQIINLSLGWPRAIETKTLQKAVQYAISRGVILVAAAGNNNSSEPLYPCAYDGVICTAASTLDGKYAGFSNFGGHVDTIAPGEGILSLAPTMFEPDFFSVPGYDIKSGTSQASPLLAGMISIVKSQEPKISLDEIYARLYSAPLNADKKKNILGGIATIETLSKAVAGPVVRPILKQVPQLLIKGMSETAQIRIPVRNYGLETTDVQVKAEVLSQGIEVTTPAQTIPALKRSGVVALNFDLHVSDFNAESSIQLKVTISSAEGELSYIKDIPVLRDIRAEAKFALSKFVFSGEKKALGTIVDGAIRPIINTVDSYGKSSAHEFFARKLDIEKKTLTMYLYRRNGNEVQEAPKAIVINDMFAKMSGETGKNTFVLYNLIRVDLNLDGKEDYLVQTLNEEKVVVGGKETIVESIMFSFFDQDLNVLWPKFPNARVTLDITPKNMATLSFMRMNHPELGAIMVPTFFGEGTLPEIDQKQDFFQRWDKSKETRLYYFEPMVATNKLRIRALTTNEWKESVKTKLGAKWFDTVMVENILPTSVADAQNGVVRVVMSVGQGTKRQIFISTFDTKNAALGAALPQIVLQTEGVDSLFSVTPTGLDVVGDTYMNIYDRSRGKIVTTKGDAQNSQLSYANVSETDILAGHIASFESAGKRLSIIQTRDELISLSSVNGKVIKTTRPKLRYSFFTSEVLAEMYNPVIYRRDGAQAPALYVDATPVTLNRIYVFEEQAGKLVASVKNSLQVPSNCKALNPTFSAKAQAHEFVFFCVETSGEAPAPGEKPKADFTIRTYEMN